MIIEKKTRQRPVYDSSGNQIGTDEVVWFDLYSIEDAIDEAGNPVRVRVLEQSVDIDDLIEKYNEAKDIRDKAQARMTKLKGFWDQIKTM